MPAPLDVAALRVATPGTAHVAHLNNAGAALMTQATLDAVVDHLRLEATIGGYEAADAAAPALAATRTGAAALLGASPDEVALTTGDTASFTKAFWGFVFGGGLRGGGRILVDRVAYGSHYAAVRQATEQHRDVRIEVLPSTPDGSVDLDALDAALDGDVRVLSLTHVPTHRGLVNPVAEAGNLCRAAGVPFFLDACQSVGQLPVDVDTIGCDVLTATGRKWLRGPRGTGLLYVRRGLLERMDPPGVDGVGALWTPDGFTLHDDATRFEEFEFGVAATIGLGVAIAEALALGLDAIRARIDGLAEGLRAALADVPGVTVRDGGRVRSGIVTFTVDGVDPVAAKAALAAAAVNVSVGTVGSAMLDMAGKGYDAVVRASPHVYNSDDELDRLVGAVGRLVA